MTSQTAKYQPSEHGVVTYLIPRVPAYMNTKQIAQIITENWKTMNIYVSPIDRIDIVEMMDNPKFVRAFIYHQPSSSGYNLNQMIQAAESKQNAFRLYFTNKMQYKTNNKYANQKRFFLVLPNKTPMTVEAKNMADQLSDIGDRVMANLATLAQAGITTIPFSVPTAEDNRFDTAILTPIEMNMRFAEKVRDANLSLQRLRKLCSQNGLTTDNDADVMREHEIIYAKLEAEEQLINQFYRKGAEPPTY